MRMIVTSHGVGVVRNGRVAIAALLAFALVVGLERTSAADERVLREGSHAGADYTTLAVIT